MKKTSFQRGFSLFCVFAEGYLAIFPISRRLFVLARQNFLCCTLDRLLRTHTEAFLEKAPQKFRIQENVSIFLPLPHFFESQPQNVAWEDNEDSFLKRLLYESAYIHGLLKKLVPFFPRCLLLKNPFTAWTSIFVYFLNK